MNLVAPFTTRRDATFFASLVFSLFAFSPSPSHPFLLSRHKALRAPPRTPLPPRTFHSLLKNTLASSRGPSLFLFPGPLTRRVVRLCPTTSYHNPLIHTRQDPLHFAMRSSTFTSLALSSLALLVAASPEPCSDHPGVIHKPGEYTVPEVQKLVNPAPKKSSSSKKKQASHKSSPPSSSSKSSGSSWSSSTSQDNINNAAPVVHKSGQTASKPKVPASGSSKSWTKNASKIKSKPAPKVQDASPQTVAKGAAEAVGSFANSSYIPPAVAGALSGGESRENPYCPPLLLTCPSEHSYFERHPEASWQAQRDYRHW